MLAKLLSGQSELLSGQADAQHTMDSGFASVGHDMAEVKELIQLVLAQSKTHSVGGGSASAFVPTHLWEVGPKELKKDMEFDEDLGDEGGWKMKSKIGGGSQGSVFVGKFRGERVAIKVMPLDTPDQVKSFEREVSILSRFAHTNVCKFYGACKRKGEGELGLELMARSLHDAIHNVGAGTKLSEKEKVSICIGTADGMMFLHGERPKVSVNDVIVNGCILFASPAVYVQHGTLFYSDGSCVFDEAAHANQPFYHSSTTFDYSSQLLLIMSPPPSSSSSSSSPFQHCNLFCCRWCIETSSRTMCASPTRCDQRL
jgi:hypothetical protein